MKKLFLIIFVFPLLCRAQSGGNLYGFYIGTDAPIHSLVGLSNVDAQNSQFSLVAPFVNTDHYAFGDHTIDPIHGHYFQVTGDSLNMYLLNFDINTGDLTNILFTVDSVGPGTSGTVTIGGNIQGTFYNCADKDVYFFHFKAPFENYLHLAKVNPNNGFVTELDSFPLGINVIDNLVIPTNQIAYWLNYNTTTFAYDQLVSYDLNNLSSTTTILSTPVPASSFWNLTYDPNDGMLYGLQEDLDSFSVNSYLADLRFIKVDPVTGDVTNLTTDFFANIIGANVCFDYTLNQLNVLIQTENPGYPRLCVFDVLAGTYTINYLTSINFGTILGPSLIGLDNYLASKGCEVATGDENIEVNCHDEIYTGPNQNGQTVMSLGCNTDKLLGEELSIYDVWGRKLFSKKIEGSEISLTLNGNSPGVYFYRITDKNRSGTTGKIVLIK